MHQRLEVSSFSRIAGSQFLGHFSYLACFRWSDADLGELACDFDCDSFSWAASLGGSMRSCSPGAHDHLFLRAHQHAGGGDLCGRESGEWAYLRPSMIVRLAHD